MNTILGIAPAQRRLGILIILFVTFWLGTPHSPAQSIGEKVGTATDTATSAVEEAGIAALTKIERLWAKIDQVRLKHRTRDEVVGWAIMGLLVGGLLNRAAGFNALGALGLGLLGAFIGGIIVKVAELDFGLGPVLIRYEDLLVSLLGAIGIVVLGKSLLGRKKATKT